MTGAGQLAGDISQLYHCCLGEEAEAVCWWRWRWCCCQRYWTYWNYHCWEHLQTEAVTLLEEEGGTGENLLV